MFTPASPAQRAKPTSPCRRTAWRHAGMAQRRPVWLYAMCAHSRGSFAAFGRDAGLEASAPGNEIAGT